MINFNDVGRLQEKNVVATALGRLQSEVALSRALSRAGSPQNIVASNRNGDSVSGGGVALLRCDIVPIGEGVLGA